LTLQATDILDAYSPLAQKAAGTVFVGETNLPIGFGWLEVRGTADPARREGRQWHFIKLQLISKRFADG
jgi:hypothetical protein